MTAMKHARFIAATVLAALLLAGCTCRRTAGDAADRRPNASSSATNSVINRSYHSQVDDVPTGSAEEKPTRMCGEKPCVTA